MTRLTDPPAPFIVKAEHITHSEPFGEYDLVETIAFNPTTFFELYGPSLPTSRSEAVLAVRIKGKTRETVHSCYLDLAGMKSFMEDILTLMPFTPGEQVTLALYDRSERAEHLCAALRPDS